MQGLNTLWFQGPACSRPALAEESRQSGERCTADDGFQPADQAAAVNHFGCLNRRTTDAIATYRVINLTPICSDPRPLPLLKGRTTGRV